MNVKQGTLLVALILVSLSLSGCLGGTSIVVDQSSTVEVMVTDQAGSPVAEADVDVLGGESTYKTDAEGRVSVTVSEASVIHVSKEGFVFLEDSHPVSGVQNVAFVGYEVDVILALLNGAETSEELAGVLSYAVFSDVDADLMDQYLEQIVSEGPYHSFTEAIQVIRVVNQSAALQAVRSLVGADPDPDELLSLLRHLVEVTPKLSDLEIFGGAKGRYAVEIDAMDPAFSVEDLAVVIWDVNAIDPSRTALTVEPKTNNAEFTSGDSILFTFQVKNRFDDDAVWFTKNIHGAIKLPYEYAEHDHGDGDVLQNDQVSCYPNFAFESGIAEVWIELKRAGQYTDGSVHVPVVFESASFTLDLEVVPGDISELRVTSGYFLEEYSDDIPLLYEGSDLLVKVTDGYNVVDYTEMHMAEVTIEIMEDSDTLLYQTMSWSVVDGWVLLDFRNGVARIDMSDTMFEQLLKFDTGERIRIALTIAIDDEKLQLSVTREIYVVWFPMRVR